MVTKKYKPFPKPVVCPVTDEVAYDYGEYLQTDYWRDLRKVTAYLHDYKCDVCGKQTELSKANIHHKTYKNIGNEYTSDLMYLCRKCHETLHKAETKEKPKKKKKKRRKKPSKLVRLIQSLSSQQKVEAYKILKEKFG